RRLSRLLCARRRRRGHDHRSVCGGEPGRVLRGDERGVLRAPRRRTGGISGVVRAVCGLLPAGPRCAACGSGWRAACVSPAAEDWTMPMHKLSKLLAILIMLLGYAAAWAQQTVLEVIPLKYRQVDEVIPVLQPLVASQGSVSGLNNQ